MKINLTTTTDVEWFEYLPITRYRSKTARNPKNPPRTGGELGGLIFLYKIVKIEPTFLKKTPKPLLPRLTIDLTSSGDEVESRVGAGEEDEHDDIVPLGLLFLLLQFGSLIRHLRLISTITITSNAGIVVSADLVRIKTVYKAGSI